jgi:hypothetical protein
MLRVSKEDNGTDDGRFTEGNFSDIPATKVSAKWLNSVQEEIVSVIKSRNISLDEKDNSQLQKAIFDLYQFGVEPITLSIQNGISSFTELPMDVFDSTKLKAIYFNALSIRHTTQADITFMTSHVASFNSYTKTWTLLTQFDPAIIKLSVTSPASPTSDATPAVTLTAGPHLLGISANGKLQYQTSKLSGDNHQGQLILSHFRYLRLS